MNLASILVLFLVLAGVCAAVRALRRTPSKGCGCSCCAQSCKGCAVPANRTVGPM